MSLQSDDQPIYSSFGQGRGRAQYIPASRGEISSDRGGSMVPPTSTATLRGGFSSGRGDSVVPATSTATLGGGFSSSRGSSMIPTISSATLRGGFSSGRGRGSSEGNRGGGVIPTTSSATLRGGFSSGVGGSGIPTTSTATLRGGFPSSRGGSLIPTASSGTLRGGFSSGRAGSVVPTTSTATLRGGFSTDRGGSAIPTSSSATLRGGFSSCRGGSGIPTTSSATLRGGFSSGRGRGSNEGNRGGGVIATSDSVNASDSFPTFGGRPVIPEQSRSSNLANEQTKQDNAGRPGGPPLRDGRAERKPLSEYIPPVRDIAEIFEEDIEQVDNYKDIAEEDEDVTIHFVGASDQHLRSVTLDTWEDAKFPEQLYKNIDRSKYTRPRKIQALTIPLILEGYDLEGHAETGSGKTAAFMLPIVCNMMKIKSEPQPTNRDLSGLPAPYAIVIEPTRELCFQVYEQGRKFANETGVNVGKAYGEYNKRSNRRELYECGGCDILCVTAGRFRELAYNNWIDFKKMKFLVLDEADRLMEMDFLRVIRSVMALPDFPKNDNRQTLLFSATFPESIQKLAGELMKSNFCMVRKAKLISPNTRIKQLFVSVDSKNKKKKKEILLEMLRKARDEATEAGAEMRRFLVFVNTKMEANTLSIYLSMEGLNATTINATLSQKDREFALRQLVLNSAQVLVTTDVCARGIDIKNLDHVINYDLPFFKGVNPKDPSDTEYDERPITYVHRIGRTGRIRPGVATTFYDEYSDNDRELASKLIEFVLDCDQTPPEFLMNVAKEKSAPAYDPASDPWANTEANLEPIQTVLANAVIDEWE